MQLSQQQLACAGVCLDPTKRLVAVTGPAGTGKTTLIKYIATQLEEAGINYAIAAPTGKASKRIREATGFNAVTVHKLLEYGRPGERDAVTGIALDITTPKRDRVTPLEYDVILVDEYSMINHELNRNIIDALPRGGRLIMFGDIAQLPPIERYEIKNANGSPFQEHLNRPGVAFELTEVFRQAEGSDVLTAANAIRAGHIPKRGENFVMNITDGPVDRLRDLVFEMEEKGIDFASTENQILSPLKQRWVGTRALNIMLRNLLNPNGGDELSLIRHKWDEKDPVSISRGDKIVCTENTYDMRNFTERFTHFREDGTPDVGSFIPTPETKYMLNGETGKVLDIYPDGGIEVDFGDRVVEIPSMYEEYWDKKGIILDVYPQRVLDLAYALTVHKAQGSEYKHVIYVMNSSIFFMLSRENLYTGVTRARQSVNLITDQKSLITSLRNRQGALDAKRAKPKPSLVKS